MKERPILFSAPMVRALLARTKKQTRRICRQQPHESNGMVWWPDGKGTDTGTCGGAPGVYLDRCPYGQPGDRLWVRETWAEVGTMDPGLIVYRADYPECVPRQYQNVPPANEITWKPSIHMFRRHSRTTLEITGIRIERLQDISEADAIAEGTAGGHGAIPGYSYAATPVEHYRWLWESINGAGSWDANPWVWVVEFKDASKGGAA